MPLSDDATLPTLLESLSRQTAGLERAGAGVSRMWESLGASHALRWVIPREFGGLEFDSATLTEGYVALAEACLTTAFVLTQRNGAVQRIASAASCPMRGELIPPHASGQKFATVGISHLTTSRRHILKPAIEALRVDGGFRLSGEVPWVTGAPFADEIVTGGTLLDGMQVLLAVDARSSGITVEKPMPLLALNASQTSAVRMENVFVPRERLLHGPAPEVMKLSAGGGAGSLGTSALAIGASGKTLRLLGEDADRRTELRDAHAALVVEREALRTDLLDAARADVPPASGPCSAETLRQRANSLVLRAAQACLAASKGGGYVSGHPAERGVREAMFFLVWSCPQPVVAAALRGFACADGWQ